MPLFSIVWVLKAYYESWVEAPSADEARKLAEAGEDMDIEEFFPMDNDFEIDSIDEGMISRKRMQPTISLSDLPPEEN